jgi:hypothetical protein
VRVIELAEPRCPECGSRLQIQTAVVKGQRYFANGWIVRGAELPVRFVTVPAVAFCSGCDFVIEIQL